MAEKSSLKVSRSVLGLLGPNELTSSPAPSQELPSAGGSAKDEPCRARETNAGVHTQTCVVLSQRTGITQMCGRLKCAPCPQWTITQP